MNRGKPEKYIALAGSIQQLMQDMELKSGDSLPSERKLAEHFKCNHITVRKSLRLLAQKNIIHTIASKGNFAGAAPLQRSRSNLIGFIFPEDEIFYYKIFSSVEKMIASNKMHPVVHLTGGSEFKETELLDYCDKAGFLALIAVPNRLCAEHYRRMSIPVLFFDIPMEDVPIPQIVTDDHSGAFSATEHLISYGHRRIAHIGSEYDFTGEQRTIGRAAIKAGADIVVGTHPHIVQGIEAYQDSYILYSLGNLVFGGNVDPDDRDAYLARVTFTVYEDHCDAPELTVVPIRLTALDKGTDYRPVVADEADSARIFKRIMKLSSGMGDFVNGELTEGL